MVAVREALSSIRRYLLLVPYDSRRLNSILQGEADVSDGDAFVEIASGIIETMVSAHSRYSARLEDRFRKQRQVLRELMRRLRVEADLPVGLRGWLDSQPSRMTSVAARDSAEAVFEPVLRELNPAHSPINGDDDAVYIESTTSLGAPERRMLDLMYEVFEPTGKWPTFQYLSGRVWEELETDARALYLDLAELSLVSPATRRAHEFQLREDTTVSASLEGLMHLGQAAEDLGRFVQAVRYIAERAATFRPASATELAQLTITDEEVRSCLELRPADPALARVGTLIREEAWQLQMGSSWGESGWSLTVNIEQARRYKAISTLADFLAISHPTRAAPAATAQLATAPQETGQPDAQRGRRRVMVVHGRDAAARDLFALLRALDLQPIEWTDAVKQTGSTRPYAGQAVEVAFESAHVAVLLLVPEETVTLRADLRDPRDALENEPAWQPRPNVLYESGIAVTAHPQQTIVLELGRPRRPTDLDGIHAIRIDSKSTWRHEFAERLRTAGCEVDTSGTEWLEVGAFNEPELE